MPVVRPISPHVGETVHDKCGVQRPHVANEDRVNAYEPRLAPAKDRHQYRHHEAQREHNHLVIPGTILGDVIREKSSRGGARGSLGPSFFQQEIS